MRTVAGQRPKPEEININGNISTSSWVVIHEGCPISLDIVGDEVHALCGTSPRHGFEFVIQAEPLREFVRLGTDALREIDQTANESGEPAA